MCKRKKIVLTFDQHQKKNEPLGPYIDGRKHSITMYMKGQGWEGDSPKAKEVPLNGWDEVFFTC
jgi:hypothetical protein